MNSDELQSDDESPPGTVARTLADHGVAKIGPQEVRLIMQPCGAFGSFMGFKLQEDPGLHFIQHIAFRANISLADRDEFIAAFRQLDAASMPERDMKFGFDGHTIYIDVNFDGMHKTIERWCPDDPKIDHLFKVAADICQRYQPGQ